MLEEKEKVTKSKKKKHNKRKEGVESNPGLECVVQSVISKVPSSVETDIASVVKEFVPNSRNEDKTILNDEVSKINVANKELIDIEALKAENLRLKAQLLEMNVGAMENHALEEENVKLKSEGEQLKYHMDQLKKANADRLRYALSLNSIEWFGLRRSSEFKQ